jgi:predicted permease
MGITGDLRYAIRSMIRTPAFTLPAVASLALGIAVNTTLFSVVSASLLRPLGAPGSDDLVRIGRSVRGNQQFRSLEYQDFTYLRQHASSLADVLGQQMQALAVGGPDGSQMVPAELVTANYFSTLGVQPALGRGFTAEEGRGSGEGPVVVVSDRFWRQRFGADAAIVGRTVTVNNLQFVIVGVAPAGFNGTFPGVDIDLWLPAAMTNAVNHRVDGRGPPSMHLIGRLRPGVSIAAAGAELQLLARRMADENPARDRDRGFAIARAQGVHPAIGRPLRVFLLLLMAVVAVVLLIACANVASLLLARASARRGELAVRLALGASRGRVITQLLVESLVLALLGGGAGLILAVWPVHVLNFVFSVSGPAGAPTSLDLHIDARVFLFTAVVTMLAALVFGLMPALQATRVDLISTLKSSQSLHGRKQFRLRGALMIVQVALSFVLLVAAVLLTRSLRNSGTLDVGFEPDHVVVASFGDLRTFGYDRQRADRFYGEWLNLARTMPGVERAALAGFVPMHQNGGTVALTVPGLSSPSGQDGLSVPVGRVSDGYFATVLQPLIRGRDFTPRDRSGAARVAIVNEALARHFWPGEDAIGKRVGVGEDASGHEIVGIARDARYASFGGEVGPFVFLPAFSEARTLLVRTSGRPSGVLADLRRAAHDVEANLPPYTGRTMRDAMASSLVPARIVQIVFSVAGVIALLLASGGLYGLVCYTLEQRLKEIGIRVALGATRENVFYVMVGSAVRLTAAGAAIGLAIAMAAMRLLSTLLYGLSPTDPLTFGGIAALLVFVTLGAGYAAARKGLDVDPMAALRHE